MYLTCITKESKILICLAGRTRVYKGIEQIDAKLEFVEFEEGCAQDISFEIRQGQTVVIEKLVTLYSNRERGILNPQFGSITEMKRYHLDRFYSLFTSHQLRWKSIWRRANVEIEFDRTPHKESDSADIIENKHVEAEAEKPPSMAHFHSELTRNFNNGDTCVDLPFILRYNIFQLVQSINFNTVGLDASLPARGLHGESYRGHIFWDEIFVSNVMLTKLPEAVRSMLLYRYNRLGAARDIAQEMGMRGACYPWQSGSSGREETSRIHFNSISKEWYPDLSWHQRHVNIAIFYNFWAYHCIAGDKKFTLQYGLEVMLEIAKFWSDMCLFNQSTGRYEIHHVMGPDEFHEKYPDADAKDAGLRNNAYTNIMVAWLLDKALRLLEDLPETRRAEICSLLQLDEETTKKWKHVTEKMTVVFHQDLVISQFEGYDQLKELDWDKYRAKYGNIGRIDLILRSENDCSDNYKLAKQADTVMIFYLLTHDDFLGTLKKNGICLFFGIDSQDHSILLREVYSWIHAQFCGVFVCVVSFCERRSMGSLQTIRGI
eukprot:TRINITY_DN2758_c0_g1_i1.p1 TRINITY_DN2758_c0_g1~~TRINITY_DN2758_c0_g1_i1.p1  ORF type:complete len:545 (-),score=140.85 TRINITY_DN2758_c0_g1_i1:687-2321(-)